jgi:hypothetical protein
MLRRGKARGTRCPAAAAFGFAPSFYQALSPSSKADSGAIPQKRGPKAAQAHRRGCDSHMTRRRTPSW